MTRTLSGSSVIALGVRRSRVHQAMKEQFVATIANIGKHTGRPFRWRIVQIMARLLALGLVLRDHWPGPQSRLYLRPLRELA